MLLGLLGAGCSATNSNDIENAVEPQEDQSAISGEEIANPRDIFAPVIDDSLIPVNNEATPETQVKMEAETESEADSEASMEAKELPEAE